VENRLGVALCLLCLLRIPLLYASGLTIVAPAAPGGGWDQTARALQLAWAGVERGASVQVDNVAGAAGTIGLARFVTAERGNPDALLVTGLVMVSGITTNQSPVTLANTTPIARLTGESEVIVVPAASPYRTFADLRAAFEASPSAIAWGGGSAGGTDDLLVRLLAESIGLAPARVNYIAFPAAVRRSRHSSADKSRRRQRLRRICRTDRGRHAANTRRLLGRARAWTRRTHAARARRRSRSLELARDRRSAGLDRHRTRRADRPRGTCGHERRVKTICERYGWENMLLTGPAFTQFLLAEQSRVTPSCSA
jgi:hypothetical protein